MRLYSNNQFNQLKIIMWIGGSHDLSTGEVEAPRTSVNLYLMIYFTDLLTKLPNETVVQSTPVPVRF